MLLAFLTYLLAGIALFWARRFGGKPERLASLSILVWIAIDPIYRTFVKTTQFGSVDWGLVVFDCGLAGAMMAIALRANRVWPVFAAAFTIVPLLGHLAAIIDHETARQAYWAINQLPFPLMLLSLMLGTAAHRRRTRLGFSFAEWST